MTKKSITALLLVLTMLFPICSFNIAYAAEIKNWKITWMGNCKGTAELDSKEKYSGAASLKIINESPDTGNVYYLMTQDVSVEAGKSYYVGAKVKAQGASTIHFCVSWEKRYGATDFGSTFDWNNFEFLYQAKETKTVEFEFLIAGVCDAVWIDDCKFQDIETGENLIKNPSFDSGVVSSGSSSSGDTTDAIYSNVTTSDTFKTSDMAKVLGAMKYIPVYRAENINIDGNTDDWASYPAIDMPAISSQYQIYIDDGKELDNKITYKFAYDTQMFYMLAEVTDNDHVYKEGGNYYWQGDSLQLAFGSMESSFGTEVGVAFGTGSTECDIYGITRTQTTAIKTYGKREGDKSVYEFCLPWDSFFSEIPDRLRFDSALNDNDGGYRRYCMELAPGIAEGKTNAQFPVLDIIEEKSDWYGWLQAPRSGYTETSYDFEYYVINDSAESREFTISADGKEEKITIPANSGIRRSFSKEFSEGGTVKMPVTVECGGKVLDISESFSIQRALPSNEETQEVANTIRKYAAGVKKLLDKCEDKGIPTDYEMIGYRILDRFPEYLEEDIANYDLTRVYYTEETCKEIYDEVTDRLNAYLNGSEAPLEVPRYMSGDREIDGVSIWADNLMPDGSVEKRPTFFAGYGHGDRTTGDTEKFSEWGANTQEMEIPLESTMSYIKGWPMTSMGSPVGRIVSDTSVKRSGERSLKIEYESHNQDNRYYMIDQVVAVEPGTSYTLKGYVKGESVTRVDISPNSWWARTGVPVGTYDWTEWSKSYTTSADQTSLTIKLIIGDPCTSFWMDDFELINDETGENILFNGGFEDATDGELPVFDENSAAFRNILSRLEANEEANSAVNLLLGPHYMSKDLIAKYDMGHTGGGFIAYNVNAPEAREIVERFIRGVIPVVKDYKCIQSVEIANEPELWFDMCGSYYRDEWTKFLEERWVDIEALNTSYGTAYTDFSEVSMGKDETNPAHYYDYVTFCNINFSGWAEWMTSIIKEIWPEANVGWKVMGYTRDRYHNRQTNGTNYEYYADFFDMNICDYWDYFDDAVEPLVGGMWYDYMRSIKEAPIANTEDHVIPDGNENYDLKHADYVGRNIWQGAIHGRAMTNIWIWGRNYVKSGVVYGGILFRPDAIYEAGKSALDLNRLAYQVTALQNEEADVGILYSESSMLLNQKAMQAAYRAYEAACYNGKNVRFVTETQKHRMHDYELMIVPLAEYVSPDTLAELVKYIENGGRVLVLGNESLSKTERNLPNDATEIKFVMDNSIVLEYEGKNDQMITPTENELIAKVREILEEEGLNYVEVTDAKTGEVTTDVEYNLGVYDGKVIVNLLNYGEDKTVKVSVNGVPVTKALELRCDKEVDEKITLVQYVPVALEVETDNPFFDTYSHWGEQEISELYGKGLVKGISPSRFNPLDNITRAEFLALINRASGFADVTYNGGIADVAVGKWYADTVQAALNSGIITNDTFRPDEAITREEMCVLLISAYEKLNGKLAEYKPADFTDNGAVSDITVVSKAASLGIIKGVDDGSFKPHWNATRAEAAAVINRFYNLKTGE